MIPVLYKEDETNFGHNGIGLLTDCISCIPHHKRNDTFILEMKYPVFGVRRDKIVAKAIIKAKADDIHDPQLFRIYSISKPSSGYITVKAEHISCELKDNFVERCSYEGNCIGALEALNNAAAFKTRFNFTSDITMTGKINLKLKNLWDCIVGTKGSIIDTYGNGADIVRDNFNIAVKQNGGTNRKVLIEYTKNLNNFKCSEDWSNCYTRIYPYVINSENQEVFSLSDKYVDSEYISRDKDPRIIPIDFSSAYQNFSDVTEDNLRAKAVAYFKNNRCDIPKLKYSLELVALSNTEEYKNAGLSEKVALFDTVIVRHKIYGIDTEIKVIEDKYNTLTEKHIKLVLNDAGTSVRSELNNITNTIVDEKIDTSIKNSASVEYVNQAISDLSAAITGCDGGYVRLNPEKNPSEILVMDNEDINSAQVVWRWNKEGWGVSTTGYNGTFVGLARDGKLVVNEATAYKMTAAMINAGILKSVDGKCWFNLENSTFNYDDFISLTKNSDGTKKFKITLSDGTDIEKKLSTVATKSEITSTANEIKMSVGESGAYNMVKNSRAEQNTNFWHGTIARYGNSSDVELTNGTYFRVDNDTTSEKFMYSDIFAVKPNTTYTLTLTVMRSAYCKNIDIHFLGFKNKSKVDTNELGYDYTHTVVPNKVYAEGIWVKEVVTFTTKSDELCGYLRFDNNGSSQAGTVCKAYFTDILMYEGVIKNSDGDIIAKPWSPYPNELYGSSVVVDKKGLEVKNQNGDRVFRADTKDGVSLTGTLLQYDLNTGNYSMEIANNMINFFDRWDTLGNHKNIIGHQGSIQVKGSYFGYNIGNTQNTRVGVGIIADVGDFVTLCSKDKNGNNNPMFIMENADGLNINQGNRFGFMQNVAFLNGAYPKWYGTLHNFIGDIHFDANSKMNIWGSGGHIMTVGTKDILTTSEIGVTVYGTFTDSSDLAYKKNVKKLDKDTLQILKDIDIYEYEENGTVEIGLLAQEAVYVVPEIIKGEVTETTIEEANVMTDEEREEKLKNGGASVDVYSMLSILWDANKKLLNKIDILENEVKILKERG